MAVFQRYGYHNTLPIQRRVKLLLCQHQRKRAQGRRMVVQVPDSRVGSDRWPCMLLQRKGGCLH